MGCLSSQSGAAMSELRGSRWLCDGKQFFVGFMWLHHKARLCGLTAILMAKWRGGVHVCGVAWA